MSLKLENSQPKATIFCDYLSRHIDFGEYLVPMEDFLASVVYVLGNTDLKENDIRLKFIELIKSSTIVEGFNPNRKRIGLEWRDLFKEL